MIAGSADGLMPYNIADYQALPNADYKGHEMQFTPPLKLRALFIALCNLVPHQSPDFPKNSALASTQSNINERTLRRTGVKLKTERTLKSDKNLILRRTLPEKENLAIRSERARFRAPTYCEPQKSQTPPRLPSAIAIERCGANAKQRQSCRTFTHQP